MPASRRCRPQGGRKRWSKGIRRQQATANISREAGGRNWISWGTQMGDLVLVTAKGDRTDNAIPRFVKLMLQLYGENHCMLPFLFGLAVSPGPVLSLPFTHEDETVHPSVIHRRFECGNAVC